MLVDIACSSRDLATYARRADAWAASESNPPSTDVIVRAWTQSQPPRQATAADVKNALAHAANARIDARARLWNDMTNDTNDES
jgi:hypothetical protein